MRQEVRLAGFGGQGIILAGYIVGKAAALYGGREAIFTQAYGPEARGGACSAELVLDDVPIDYALVTTPSILVLMSQEAYEKFGTEVEPPASVLIESDLVYYDTAMEYAPSREALQSAMKGIQMGTKGLVGR